VSSLWAVGKDLVNNPNWFTGENSTAEKFVFEPADEQVAKMHRALNKGRYSEAFGHALAAATPLVGPWAAGIGEQAGSGDVGGAVGQTVGGIAAGEAVAKLPKGLKIVKEHAPGIVEGAKEHIPDAVKPKPAEVKASQQIKQVATGVGPNFAERLNRTIERGYLPEIERKYAPRTVRDTANAILDYADTIQKNVIKPAVERNAMSTISGDEIAKAVGDVISPTTEKYFPESLKAVVKESSRYAGKEIRLDEALELNEKLNAINRTLDNASAEDSAAAQKINAGKAATKAAAEKLRDLLYDKLDSLGEKGIRDFQKDYGALRSVGEALRDKAPVAERIGTGPGLIETSFRKHPWLTLMAMAGGYGLHSPAMAVIPFMRWIMDRRATPNAKMGRAMKKLGKTEFTPAQPPVPIQDIDQSLKNIDSFFNKSAAPAGKVQ
jgi:hypothetical protein